MELNLILEFINDLFSLSNDLPVTITSAPFLIKFFAVSFPIPRLPPVIIMFFPFYIHSNN